MTERTIEQEPAFAIRVIVDIADKALSAAINNPTTAVRVLDHLEEVDAADRSDRPRRSAHAAVCRDPYDDYLVAVGVASGADAIITGDLDLLAVDAKQLSFEVITPRQLVDRLG